MRVRTIAAAVLAVAAVAGGAPGSAPAAKTKPKMDVFNTFAVTYEATVNWKAHESQAPWTGTSALSYTVKGALPNVVFNGTTLIRTANASIGTTVEGDASDVTTNPEGTSVDCHGTAVQVSGAVGVGKAPGGTAIWFLPAIGGTASGDCTDSDGKHSPMELKVGWPAGTDVTTAAPPDATLIPLTLGAIDRASWSKPFRITFDDEKCPRYSPSMTISCSYEIKGELRMTRVEREEHENFDHLLAPDDPPKLNRKKTKATTEVECTKACDIEAMIGVFGGTRKHPKVTPIRTKKMRLKADKATTISLPLNAKARTAAKQGRLVMTLKVKGGKRQIYPLI